MLRCPRDHCNGSMFRETERLHLYGPITDTWVCLLCSHRLESPRPLTREPIVLPQRKRGRPMGWPKGRKRKGTSEASRPLPVETLPGR